MNNLFENKHFLMNEGDQPSRGDLTIFPDRVVHKTETRSIFKEGFSVTEFEQKSIENLLKNLFPPTDVFRRRHKIAKGLFGYGIRVKAYEASSNKLRLYADTGLYCGFIQLVKNGVYLEIHHNDTLYCHDHEFKIIAKRIQQAIS